MVQTSQATIERARFAMTIDVEEWFTGAGDGPHEVDRFESRLEIGMTRVLDLLGRYGVRATFFFLGYLVERQPDWVKRVASLGHEIGLHGHYHIPLSAMTPAEFRTSVVRARDALINAGASRVVGFRAPLFSVNAQTSWALEVLDELGFEYDSSIFPIHNPRYGYPSAPRLPFRATESGRLLEFPISTARFLGVNLPFAGGFYLRALPLWLIKEGFRRSAAAGELAVCYLHPWELDPDQPRLEGSIGSQLRHRIGLSGVSRKLEALLDEFRFAPMHDVLLHQRGNRRLSRLRLASPQRAPHLPDIDPPHT